MFFEKSPDVFSKTSRGNFKSIVTLWFLRNEKKKEGLVLALFFNM